MREQINTDEYRQQIPALETDNYAVNRAWQLAVDDLLYNVCLYQDGLLKQKEPVILAGGGYDTPWTRDAAINTWNAGGILIPEVAKNTLLSVLTEENGTVRVGGQYWDAIIWVIGAWNYWLYTGDADFYPLMKECAGNSLAYFEETEWDKDMGLFRGPACYGDGIAAYPDRYVAGGSGIMAFPKVYPERCAEKGVGIPIFTLSTNCLYAESYRLAFVMTGKDEYREKSESLKARINEVFWNEESGLYDYAVDKWGREERQEALGESFAILFGIADERKKESILNHIKVSGQGITCLYPGYERYLPYGMGRHCGSVWPFAQAFFGDAAAKSRPDRLAFELRNLTRNALRSGQFAEIYHPRTGEPCGGVQEAGGPIQNVWVSQPRQTWSATGYLRMLLLDVAGLRFEEGGIRICPVKIPEISSLSLKGLRYRDAVIDLTITPAGWKKEGWIPAETKGRYQVEQ